MRNSRDPPRNKHLFHINKSNGCLPDLERERERRESMSCKFVFPSTSKVHDGQFGREMYLARIRVFRSGRNSLSVSKWMKVQGSNQTTLPTHFGISLAKEFTMCLWRLLWFSCSRVQVLRLLKSIHAEDRRGVSLFRSNRHFMVSHTIIPTSSNSSQ